MYTHEWLKNNILTPSLRETFLVNGVFYTRIFRKKKSYFHIVIPALLSGIPCLVAEDTLDSNHSIVCYSKMPARTRKR